MMGLASGIFGEGKQTNMKTYLDHAAVTVADIGWTMKFHDRRCKARRTFEMTEREKKLKGELYDANFDKEYNGTLVKTKIR